MDVIYSMVGNDVDIELNRQLNSQLSTSDRTLKERKKNTKCLLFLLLLLLFFV